MFIRELLKCDKFVAGDNSILRELFNPLKDPLNLGYSLAHAIVEPGNATSKHTLSTSEVYYILKGRGIMFIDNESEEVREGCTVYIPPSSIQNIKNIGKENLVFLCIVDPAWKKEDEQVLE